MDKDTSPRSPIDNVRPRRHPVGERFQLTEAGHAVLRACDVLDVMKGEAAAARLRKLAG